MYKAWCWVILYIVACLFFRVILWGTYFSTYKVLEIFLVTWALVEPNLNPCLIFIHYMWPYMHFLFSTTKYRCPVKFCPLPLVCLPILLLYANDSKIYILAQTSQTFNLPSFLSISFLIFFPPSQFSFHYFSLPLLLSFVLNMYWVFAMC